MSLTCAKLRCFSRILRVDGVERLLAAARPAPALWLGEGLLDLPLDAVDDVAAVARAPQHGLRQRRVAPAAQVLERQLLQLAVGLVQAQAVGDGGVDLERLARDAHALVGRPCAAIVRMLCRRSASLIRMTRTSRAIASSILRNDSGLRSPRGVENCSLSSLVRPSTRSAVGAPKRSISSDLGDAAVFHRVVHQRGHDGLRVELPLGAHAGHGDRVGDVGLAAGAELAQVGLVGEPVGVAHAA